MVATWARQRGSRAGRWLDRGRRDGGRLVLRGPDTHGNLEAPRKKVRLPRHRSWMR
jgi:hypothetical protein